MDLADVLRQQVEISGEIARRLKLEKIKRYYRKPGS